MRVKDEMREAIIKYLVEDLEVPRDAISGDSRVVLNVDGAVAWTEREDGVWKIFSDGEDGSAARGLVPPQSPPEVARALFKRLQELGAGLSG